MMYHEYHIKKVLISKLSKKPVKEYIPKRVIASSQNMIICKLGENA